MDTPFSQSAPVSQSPSESPYQQPSQGTTQTKRKNPLLALILSLLICGVGQMYNGQIVKGVIMLIATIIMAFLFWPISLIVLVYSGATTPTRQTNKINNGESV